MWTPRWVFVLGVYGGMGVVGVCMLYETFVWVKRVLRHHVVTFSKARTHPKPWSSSALYPCSFFLRHLDACPSEALCDVAADPLSFSGRQHNIDPPQNAHKMIQGSPKTPQDAPKRPLRQPKTLPRRPQDTPKTT